MFPNLQFPSHYFQTNKSPNKQNILLETLKKDSTKTNTFYNSSFLNCHSKKKSIFYQKNNFKFEIENIEKDILNKRPCFKTHSDFSPLLEKSEFGFSKNLLQTEKKVNTNNICSVSFLELEDTAWGGDYEHERNPMSKDPPCFLFSDTQLKNSFDNSCQK